MIWNPEKAKKYMQKVAIDHIRDGLKIEGAELILASIDNPLTTKAEFIKVFKEICWWDEEDLEMAVFEAMNPAFI